MNGANGGSADRPLRALSDAELVTESLPCASNAGCYPWLIALTVPVPIGLLFGAAWALLSLLLGVLVCRLLTWLRERSPRIRRARQAEAEFDQRFGAVALDHAVEEARVRLASDGDVAAIVCLHGRGLPHGDQRLVRVDLGSQEATLYVHQASYLADLWQHPERVRQIRRGRWLLTPAATAPMHAAVTAVARNQAGPEATFVYDGFPCTVVLLRRGEAPQRWDLNLRGVGPKLAGHAVILLISSLFELQRATEDSER